MPENQNIVIIGGTACGPKTAARARRCDQRRKITVIEQRGNLSTATCGFPYFVSKVIKSKDDLLARPPEYFKNVLDIDLMINTRASAIDRKNHRVEVVNTESGETSSLGYDKLVLATGSTPAVPPLEGKDLPGIFTLNNMEDAFRIYDFILKRKVMKAVVVGAGLIGMEMTETFAELGIKVTVMEALDWTLPALLDFETAAYVGKHLKENGVQLLFGQPVSGFDGDMESGVKKVIAGDTEIDADIVLMALGNRPNTGLAKDAGLEIGATRGIVVDNFLRTSDPDIYAGGDCVENTNRITGQKVLSLMGSTANKHGRIIGSNLTGGNEEFSGVTGTAIVKIFGYNVGRTGLTEAEALQAGYDVVTSLVPSDDHARFYPDAQEILVKMVADRSDGRLLGGQVVGPGETAKRVDVLSTALTFGAKAGDIANLDLAYAPPYNSAIDPLHHAANVIRNKRSGMGKSVSPMEAKNKFEENGDIVVLDVRNPDEWETGIIDAKEVTLIPLGILRKKLGKLSNNKEVLVYCRTSIRAYQAQLMLDDAGFDDVKFIDGSLNAWPYGLKAMPKKGEGK